MHPILEMGFLTSFERYDNAILHEIQEIARRDRENGDQLFCRVGARLEFEGLVVDPVIDGYEALLSAQAFRAGLGEINFVIWAKFLVGMTFALNHQHFVFFHMGDGAEHRLLDDGRAPLETSLVHGEAENTVGLEGPEGLDAGDA